MKDKQLASIIEEKRTKQGDYPPYWPLMSKQVKALAGWCCERCGVRNNEEAPDGTMLTVHHLDGNKWNCEWWNLAALCQRCHLRVQSRVVFRDPYFRWNWDKMKGEAIHSRWLARHIKGFNVWAGLEGIPPLPLDRVEERDYSREWRK
jgi:5-methylcytosine-specific restriction endonuclease McrA